MMKEIRFAKFLVLLNCTVPVILLGYDAWRHELGANPVNFAIRTTGLLALIFLVLSLIITPSARLSGLNWLSHFRRTLGLYAFFHTAAHFLIFFVFDQSGSVSNTFTEIFKRNYLLVGTFGLVLMTPLAVTSTNGMIKRLGSARWKALHRLAYLAAIAGGLHYYMLVKSDVRQPIAFLIVIGILLAYRLVIHYVQLRAGYNKLRNAPAIAPTKPKFWTGTLRVARIFNETPDVRTFRLTTVNGAALPFDYQPGQYLNLSLQIEGKKVARSYTIASAPSRANYCELSVKREAVGLASRHLHDQIHEGDILNISAPAGRFTFNGTGADRIVLIAGGVGITPLMSKIRYLTDTCWTGDIYLIYSAKTEKDIIFKNELDYLQSRHPNLHIHITLTRADATQYSGNTGRITGELIRKISPDLQSTPFHICGPTEMTDPTRQMLRDLGVPEDHVHFESFTSPSRSTSNATVTQGPAETPPANSQNDTANLTFTRSGQTVSIPVNQSILEASEEAGISINYDCRSGICGQCKVKLLSGQVTMEAQDALDESDRANSIILSCQARCLEDVSIEV